MLMMPCDVPVHEPPLPLQRRVYLLGNGGAIEADVGRVESRETQQNACLYTDPRTSSHRFSLWQTAWQE